jgi:tetratricopeptide (TPR) repeat protein
VFEKLDAMTTAEPSLQGLERLVTLTWLGDIYLKQDKLKEAESVYLRFLDLPNKNSTGTTLGVRLGLAEMYRRSKEFAKAEVQASAAVTLANRVSSQRYAVQSLNLLGQVYEEQGKHGDAEAQYKKALERAGSGLLMANEKVVILENYARLLKKLNRADEAVKMFDEANKLRGELKESRN